MATFDDSETSTLPTEAPVQQTGAPAPAQAATPAPMPQTPKSEQKTQAAPSQFDAFKDPKFLTDAAQIYLDSGDENGLKWLEYAHQAVRENAVQAAQHLIAGDGEAAIKAWNSSGRHTDAESAQPNGDGTWTITRKGGSTLQIDPQQEMQSLMSPEAFSANQVAKQRANTEQTSATARAGLESAQAGWYRDRSDTQAYVAEIRGAAQVEAARLRDAVGRAQMTGDQAAAKLDAQYGPVAVFKNTLEKAQTAGDTDPFKTATRAVIETGAVIAKPAPSGEIYLINPHTNDMWKVLPNAAAYKAITGQDIYVPKVSGGATPAGVAKAQPVKQPPTGPATGMTVAPAAGGDAINLGGMSDRDLQTQASNVHRPQLAALARAELMKRSTNQGPTSPAQPTPADMAQAKSLSLRDLQFLATQEDPANTLIPAAKLELERRRGQ